jgi:hypothetical protein
VVRRLATEAPRWPETGLDAATIAPKLDALTSPADTRAVLDAVREQWQAVLRDPSTRTNGYLVRRGELDALQDVAGAVAR